MRIPFARCSQSLLLAAFLAGGIVTSFAQTDSAAPKTAPKKAATATHSTAAKKASTAKKPATTVGPVTLTTPEQKLSYALGLDMGKRLKASGVNIDPALLQRGLSDSMAGNKPLMSEDEIRSTIASAQKDLQQKQMAKIKEMGDKNKKEGDEFLAANKSK
jgi:Domain amino terminal to FKBP-type peptidyl-prolyl isomerase